LPPVIQICSRFVYTQVEQNSGFAKSGETCIMGELLQPMHLLVILLVAFVFFGGKKLPELGAGLGKGIRSFKDSLREVTADHDKIETTTPKQPETADKAQ